MKLWVDDIRNAPDDSWHVARTVNAAIRAMYRFKYEIKEISLDHDISHQIGMEELSRPYPCTETFQAVAYYIAELWMLERNLEVHGRKSGLHAATTGISPKITIHSSNPVGAREMKAILAESGIEAELRPMGRANRLEMEV